MPPASAAAAASGPSPAELRRLRAALWRLLAVGDRYETEIAANKAADAKYR